MGIQIFDVKSPLTPPPGGSPWGKGIYFKIRWVVATCLELLSSNLVCKPYLGLNINFWSEISHPFEVKSPEILPPPRGLLGERGYILGHRWVVATF